MSFNAINADPAFTQKPLLVRITLLVSHTYAIQGKANDSIYDIRDRISYIESAK